MMTHQKLQYILALIAAQRVTNNPTHMTKPQTISELNDLVTV